MSEKSSNAPTRGQIERALSQSIQKLYREQLGHSTGKITCQLRDDNLTVVIESSLTQPEQVLLEGSEASQVEKIRANLDEAVRPKVIEIVQKTLNRPVVDILSDTTLETERTGLVIVLGSEGSSEPAEMSVVEAS